MSVVTSKQWGQLYALAWKDRAFKALLEQDPRKAIDSVADQLGIDKGARIQVPDCPDDLTADQLTQIVDGKEIMYLTAANSC